jgi:hypothetical protein
LNITAAFAVGFRLRAAACFVAGELVELGIEAAGRKFLFGLNLLAAFPPVAFLGGLGDGLGAGIRLLLGLGPIFSFPGI